MFSLPRRYVGPDLWCSVIAMHIIHFDNGRRAFGPTRMHCYQPTLPPDAKVYYNYCFNYSPAHRLDMEIFTDIQPFCNKFKAVCNYTKFKHLLRSVVTLKTTEVRGPKTMVSDKYGFTLC